LGSESNVTPPVSGAGYRLARALAVGLCAGILLALLETAGILASPGAPGAPPMDILVVATWLALPYAAAFGALAAALALMLPASGAGRGLATGLVVAAAFAIWLRTLLRLGEGTAAYPVLEMLVAGAAVAAGALFGMMAARSNRGYAWRAPLSWGGLAALAVLVALSGNVPGPFGAPGTPISLWVRLSWALVAGVAAAALRHLADRPGARGRVPGRVVRVAAVLAAAVWVLFCGEGFARILSAPESGPGSTHQGDGSSSRPNVILISIDTLRADHVSCYGYGRPTTPGIDHLAASGVLFTHAVSTASFTTPAHASMMTGLFPTSHGAQYQRDDPDAFVISPIASSVPTLAEILADQGYDTAAFVASPMVGRQFGFGRGFRVFDDHYDRLSSVRGQMVARSTPFRLLRRTGIYGARDLDAERKADEVNAAAMRWIERRRGSTAPFFLFVHYYDPHAPYAAPERLLETHAGAGRVPYDLDLLLRGQYTLSAGARDAILEDYDEEIAYADRAMSRLLDALGPEVVDRSLIIVTSDHGESFGEHGHWGHNILLYEDLIDVPFVVRPPGGTAEARVIDDVIAQPTDIQPTVLAWLGIRVPAGTQGRDLAGIIDPGAHGPSQRSDEGPPVRQLAFAELARNVGWARRWGPALDRDLLAARAGRWKYIRSSRGTEELYDLEADPAETHDLAAADPVALDSMRRLMDSWRLTQTRHLDNENQELDEGLLENLRSLGYVQ